MTPFEKTSERPSCRHSAKKRPKRSVKTVYKHVPHCEKPPHLVARRNARERRRVETVNNAFIRLRRHVPVDTKHKRISKVKTLRYAIDYIRHLTDMINKHDRQFGTPCCNFGRTVAMVTPPTVPDRESAMYKEHDLQPEVSIFGPWYHAE